MNPNQPSLPARLSTPALDRRLAELERRLTRLVWAHGLGTLVAATGGWLLVAFTLDWALHVPAFVRWIHLTVLVALAVACIWRALARPLAKLPDRAGLAVLIERAHPELRELVISAVQLSASSAPTGAPELVAGVLREAEARAPTLDLGPVLDGHVPRQRFMLGAAAALGCVCVALFAPQATNIFLARLFGRDTAWPQRTTLELELPLAKTDAAGGPVRELRIARGSDVPVIVHAKGLVPDEVTLHLGSAHEMVLPTSGAADFRTLLRSLSEDIELWATGGDDQDGQPRWKIVVLEPPDVLGVALTLEPPAYSGIPTRTIFEPEAEVLAGTRIVAAIKTKPANARGNARILPQDQVFPLVPARFPRPSGAASTPVDTNPAAEEPALSFQFMPEKSVRYRIELTDDTGLSNPDPGLYAISVVADRAPEVELIAPGRGELDTVVGGWIALRVLAEDDFGLASAAWSAAAGAEGTKNAGTPHALVLEPLALGANNDATSSAATNAMPAATDSAVPEGKLAKPRARAFARARLSAQDLAGADKVTEGAQYTLVVSVLDNCMPTAHEGKSSPVRVRVVSNEEFLRRTQDRLNRAQASASALAELAREKRRRIDELVGMFAGDAPLPEGGQSEVASAGVGARRVQGDSKALARELCSLCESVLYARVDERAQAALEFLDLRLSRSSMRGFDAAPWRELALERAGGKQDGGALAGKLIDIASLALEIGEDHATAATAALASAEQATEPVRVHAELARASNEARQAQEKIERLLELLAEWDNFQSVLNLTRDILGGQKSLNERTRQFAKDH